MSAMSVGPFLKVLSIFLCQSTDFDFFVFLTREARNTLKRDLQALVCFHLMKMNRGLSHLAQTVPFGALRESVQAL